MDYPKVSHHLFDFYQQNPWISIDFEFPPSTMEPNIMGLCSGGEPVSVFYDSESRNLLRTLASRNITWVGHNSLTVEREIIENETGIPIPLSLMEDTMLRHYLCNAELCKGVVKGEEDEANDKRGQGYMDLWSMSSIYTELPQWKQCRGVRCEGPCRLHDVLGYNGIDSLAPDIALPRLMVEMEEKGIPDRLYQNLKKLTVLCDTMQRRGIKVDRGLVGRLEKEFNDKKESIFASKVVPKIGKKGQELKTKELVFDAPFNPRSPKQVVDWFASRNIILNSTEKDEIQKAVDHLGASAPDDARELLSRLYDYKDAGKGLKAWMAERYFGRDDLMHPRFIVPGSSLGRLASSDPNFQNIPRIGWGRGVRAAIIPRDPSLILAKADKSQLELRICLWYAGYDMSQLPPDAFKWLVAAGEGTFEKCAEIVGQGKSARDLAKSVSHGGDYGEGVKVLYGRDLDSPRTRKMISEGALVVYDDWEYMGGVVAFTGSNLAERLFGSASWENRRKALQIQEAYFGKFKAIREWQRKVSEQVETGHISSASGRYLTLLGSPEDKFKIALAFYGQGGGADDVQEGMLRYADLGFTPLLQVHDELVFEFPRETSNEKLLDHFRIMSMPSEYMPGFTCPVKASKGENWLDMEEMGKV